MRGTGKQTHAGAAADERHAVWSIEIRLREAKAAERGEEENNVEHLCKGSRRRRRGKIKGGRAENRGVEQANVNKIMSKDPMSMTWSTHCEEDCAVDEVSKQRPRATRKRSEHGVHDNNVTFFGRADERHTRERTRQPREQ